MKAKIYVTHNGKTYRVGKSFGCASRRDCDLFQRGWCDNEQMIGRVGLPCVALNDAFIEAIGSACKTCFKEVRK